MKTIYTEIDELKVGLFASQTYNDGGGNECRIYYKVILKKRNTAVLEYVGCNKKDAEDHGFMIVNGKHDLGYALLSPISEKEMMIDIL